MRLVTLFESGKSKLLEIQRWLLEKGWDDVELNHISTRAISGDSDKYQLTLRYGTVEKHYGCLVNDHEIDEWYEIGGFQPAEHIDTRSFKEAALNTLVYAMIRGLNVKLLDKPNSFDDILKYDGKYIVPFSKLKPFVEDGRLGIYNGRGVFGFPGRPSGPLASHAGGSMPPIFIVEFSTKPGVNDMWLVDSTGANSYYREWARVDHEA